MIREFGLKNEYGQSYSLNDIRKGFLHEPEGLGYAIDRSYALFGSEWIKSDDEIEQTMITGTVVFGSDSPYQRAKEFTEFVLSSKKLTLSYKTDAGLYYKDIDINKFEKAEIGRNHKLECKIEMAPRTLWYLPNNIILRLEQTTGVGLIFPFRLPNQFVNYSNGVITVNNDGHVPAPFKCTIQGEISNPTITLLVEGKEIASVPVITDVDTGGTLEYSSKDGDIYLYKVSSGGIRTDLAESLDIANENIFKIPIGTSQLRVTADSAITHPVTFTIYKQYMSV